MALSNEILLTSSIGPDLTGWLFIKKHASALISKEKAVLHWLLTIQCNRLIISMPPFDLLRFLINYFPVRRRSRTPIAGNVFLRGFCVQCSPNNQAWKSTLSTGTLRAFVNNLDTIEKGEVAMNGVRSV